MAESTERVGNRWIIVIAAILIQLALGAIYSYGVMKPELKLAYDADDTTALMPFAFGLLSFAIVMVFAGRWQDRAGPKIVALVGGIVLLAGYLLSALLAPVAGSLWVIAVTYGIVGGAGIGFGYVCPIACATKWFPDKKGLINGIAVAGFGAGAFLFNQVFDAFLPSYDLTSMTQAEIDALKTALVTTDLPLLFLVSGLLMGGMVIVGALLLKNPPEGYKPAGWEPPVQTTADGKKAAGADWTPKEMIQTPTFWLLWAMFIFSAICGLMVIGNYKSYGKFIDNDFATAFAATIGGTAALFNGLGRIFWGKMSDSLGRTNAMKIMFGIQGVVMIVFAVVPNIILWVVLVQVLYFCFGGNFSMFPSATGEYFGTKNLGSNYGLVFTAYGIAGIAGAVAATPMLNALGGNYLGYFLLWGILSLAALVMSFVTKPPKAK